MKKRRILVLALTLVAVFAASITYAYFTDTSDEVENTFTMGNVEIELDEADVSETTAPTGTTWTVEDPAVRVLANTYSGVFPGAVLPKDPTVHNTGSNPAYVRVKVTMTQHGAWEAMLEDPSDILGTLGEGWTFISEEDGEYIFHYDTIVNVDASTSALFTQVTIPTSIDNAGMESIDGFQINVIAEAIQAQGFADTAVAFAAFDE